MLKVKKFGPQSNLDSYLGAFENFGKAFWKTKREINADQNVKSFKNVKHFGCAFNFDQAVYRRIQKLGLGSTYNRNRG